MSELQRQHEFRPIADHPENYLPFSRNTAFQPRPGEFERLERLLFGNKIEQTATRVGLVGVGVTGLGGIGKTQLAVELAHRYRERFPGGVFWMAATGTTLADWQRDFAELAVKTKYLPGNEEISNPEHQFQRAQYLCRYLAHHADALLILDNVEDPELALKVLPTLAGSDVNCIILYTSRNTETPFGVTSYPVEKLPPRSALRLLLMSRPALLMRIEQGFRGAEENAAFAVCHLVGYLPLALVLLRDLLRNDQHLTLVSLAEGFRQYSPLEITGKVSSKADVLTATFQLSWEKVHSEEAKRLLKIASYFPEATPIPLWLVGLATGFGERAEPWLPLGKAVLQLQQWSLVERLSGEQIRLHPLIRDFGRRLLTEDGVQGKQMLSEVGECLLTALTDLDRLEERAKLHGYHACLEQVQAAYDFTQQLGMGQHMGLAQVVRWMGREEYLLKDRQWWPGKIAGLFYQQLYNRAVEEGHALEKRIATTRWLRQVNQVDAGDRSLLRIYVGHSDRVNTVAFSPDGTRILTGSADGTARLWEASSGTQLVTYPGHSGSVKDVAFSPDGKQVLTGSADGMARLWEASSGRQLMTYSGHSDWVNSVAFSPDGTRILTGSADGTARLWEANSGRQLMTYPGHSGSVWDAAFSPDGKQILMGCADGTTQLWEASFGRQLMTYPGHSDWVNGVAFSPDGTCILTGSGDKTARLWETSSGRQLATYSGHSDWVNGVAFSPDGKQVLTGSADGTARLWETISGRQLMTYPGHSGSVTSVRFARDGKHILTSSGDMTARLWEVVSSKPLGIYSGHSSQITSVAFSRDGTRILTGSADGTARLWEVASSKPLGIYSGHSSQITSVAFSPDGKQILTGSADRTARLWETNSGTQLVTYPGHSDWVNSVAFSPNGTHILTGFGDGTARLWESSSGTQLVTYPGHSSAVSSVTFSPDGRHTLTSFADGTTRLWETSSGRQLVTYSGHSDWVNSVAFSPDGKQILTGSADGTARLWETSSGRQLVTYSDQLGQINRISFSSDGAIVVTCCVDKVYFWCAPEASVGKPLGMYVATYKVDAIYWQDRYHLLLADTGGPHFRPHVYQLTLEGEW